MFCAVTDVCAVCVGKGSAMYEVESWSTIGVDTQFMAAVAITTAVAVDCAVANPSGDVCRR